MTDPEMCSWLHLKLESLPIIKFPFDNTTLPERGIYFFYEDGEKSDDGNGLMPRIVRVGTHKKDNFRSRISEHFLINESKMNFSQYQPKPSDRSIFRKNIGQTILNGANSSYLELWETDFTTRANRIERGAKRIMELEKKVEKQITKIIRERFSLRYIQFDNYKALIGSQGMELKLIGTIAGCNICTPSITWLGRYCPTKAINSGKLWLSQGLNSAAINNDDKNILNSIIDSCRHIK